MAGTDVGRGATGRKDVVSVVDSNRASTAGRRRGGMAARRGDAAIGAAIGAAAAAVAQQLEVLAGVSWPCPAAVRRPRRRGQAVAVGGLEWRRLLRPALDEISTNRSAGWWPRLAASESEPPV